jgi:hypothetical protein
VKEAKKYDYVTDIFLVMSRTLETCTESLREQVPVPEGDPRLIAPTIAPVQPQPTAVIVSQQVSRFLKPEA